MVSTLAEKIEKRRQQGNLRSLKHFQKWVDFASNDYLGLSRSPILHQAVLAEISKEKKLGSTGSRLLTGHSEYVDKLEEKIASFHGFETGLLFNCGYMANVGLLSAIAKEEDSIFYDMQVHASTHDGMRLSKTQPIPFKHNDLNHLEERLKNRSHGNAYICIESVYSTDGSHAPLKEMCDLADRYGAHIVVDEAHAVGVLGPQGKGLVAEYGLIHRVFAQVTTFGKALGGYGAIVLGSQILKQFLINFSRPFIYSTALPFPILALINCSYDMMPRMQLERDHIKKLIKILDFSKAPIQAIKVKGNQAVKHAAEVLNSQGFDVRPLMSPTVKRDHEAIRICLHAFNSVEQTKDLKLCIESLLPA